MDALKWNNMNGGSTVKRIGSKDISFYHFVGNYIQDNFVIPMHGLDGIVVNVSVNKMKLPI